MNHNLRLRAPSGPGTDTESSNLVKVVVDGIQSTHPAFGDVTEEALWARRLHDGSFQIDNIPFFKRGLSYGDVVNVRPGNDDVLHVGDVIGRSGHSTYRVAVQAPLKDRQHADYHELLSTLKYLGVNVESATPTFFAVDVPPTTPAQAVYDVLELGLEYGIWDFDEGYAAPSPDDHKP